MTKPLYEIFLFLVLIGLFSCTDNRTKRKAIVAEKIKQVLLQQNDWNSLTDRILENNYVKSNLGKIINPKDLNEPLSSELTEKGIKWVTAITVLDCKEVEYYTEWTNYPIGALYLKWSNCDTIQTQKGYYKDDFNLNFTEVWGVGNNWLIWTDSDFK